MNISSMLTLTKLIDSAYGNMCQPVLREFGISKTSFDILMFLRNNPAHYTAREISELRKIKPNVVSLHVEKLCRDGYLERRSVEGDRRKVRLVCTEKASPITDKGRAMQLEFYRQLLDGVTQEDLDGLKRCFDCLAQNAGQIHSSKS